MGFDAIEADRLGWEEKYLRAVRARRRFKALVRLVLENRAWIAEVEAERISDNYKQNIRRIIMAKKHRKHALKISDIAILIKPVHRRTREEKQHLQKLVNRLNVFTRYPRDVKDGLAEKTLFAYFGPNRVIIRQDRQPISMYFLVSGEVSILKKTFEPISETYIDQEVAVLTEGNLFGEVAILHSIPRTATCITKTDCELLFLTSDDFNLVLRNTVRAFWDYVIVCMGRLGYFNRWNAISRRECCILTRTRSFKRNDTILGDGFGQPDYTYFVMKGKCRVIEQLFLEFEIVNGVKKYKLWEPPEDSDTESVHSLDERTPVKSQTSIEKDKSKSHLFHKKSTKSVVSLGETTRKLKTSHSTLSLERREAVSKNLTSYLKLMGIDNPISAVKETPIVEESTESSSTTEIILPDNVETHFIQVCTYIELAVFNIGENLKNRRILAIDDVECLLMPRYFLMRNNNDNVWTKVQQFLDLRIPSTKDVYKQFFLNKRWRNYKKQLVEDIVSKKKSPPCNNIYNVPYSIRIKEISAYE